MPRTRPILRRKFLVLSGERTGSLSVNLDDFLASVCSASLAYTVRKIVLTALRALDHTGHIKLPYAGTSLISSC